MYVYTKPEWWFGTRAMQNKSLRQRKVAKRTL